LPLIIFRRAISIVVFILFVLMFLNIEPLAVFLSKVLPPFQAVPALMWTIIDPATLFTAGLILILILTMFFGRIYCSLLCPLGALQDLMTAGFRRLNIRQHRNFDMPLNYLRYSVLILTVATFWGGSLWLVCLLDPYSFFGRMIVQLAGPILTEIYNPGVAFFNTLKSHFHPKEAADIPLQVSAITAVFFLILAYLSATRGRLYCNTLCPVGTLLGLVARRSFFQLIVNRQECLECMKCKNVCKSNCLDPQTAFIDMSRCVGCFNCLSVCSKNVIRFGKRQKSKTVIAGSPTRRQWLVGSLAAVASLIVLYDSRSRSFFQRFAANANPPVTPPGSQNTVRFAKTCTSCSLCVSACPTKVLTPSVTDFDLSGLFQPRLNFDQSYCDYECNLCGNVCPTGAILPIALEEKKIIQIGEANLLQDVCVVYLHHQNCGACGEVCPTHAIRFTNKKNILYPEIDKPYCIGCGACRLACPTTPKSLVIRAYATHQKAARIDFQQEEKKPKSSSHEDFPF
jgi:ferredoxin